MFTSFSEALQNLNKKFPSISIGYSEKICNIVKPLRISGGFLFSTNVKNFTKMTKHQATAKIKNRLLNKTKDEVSKELGISRPTLDARLSWNTWKISEIALIEKL